MSFIRILKQSKLIVSAMLLILSFSQCTDVKKEQKPNILFIAVDDFRPELNSYGESYIISPNIDNLAADGIRFQRAYCNVPVCGASRASLLSGVIPASDRFTSYGARVDEEVPSVPTIVETLKNNGYFTTSLGKIFHHPNDGLKGWSELPYRPDYPNSLDQQELWRDYQSEDLAWTKEKDLPLGACGPAWESADVPDNGYYDGKTVELALGKLEELSNKEQPFFFGLGFIRPHLPFNCPKKYWDMYKPEDIPLATNPFMPEYAPDEANFYCGELRSYENIEAGREVIADAQANKLKHGYAACVSYVDAQIGLVIDKLKELDMYDNTIIVLWGDHGWSLGEHTHWGKHTCFNRALQVPLIVRTPEGLKGKTTRSLVSLIDLYPTLCDLAGAEQPAHLDGKSFVPVLSDVEATVNDYVFCRWHTGETIKSDKYMYTQYFNKKGNKVVSQMLYNHQIDPDENVNVVDLPENEKLISELGEQIKTHMKTR